MTRNKESYDHPGKVSFTFLAGNNCATIIGSPFWGSFPLPNQCHLYRRISFRSLLTVFNVGCRSYVTWLWGCKKVKCPAVTNWFDCCRSLWLGDISRVSCCVSRVTWNYLATVLCMAETPYCHMSQATRLCRFWVDFDSEHRAYRQSSTPYLP